MKTDTFELKEFSEFKHHDLLEELTQLLHDAYKPLAEKGLEYLATHQPPETTLSRLKKGKSFLGFVDGKLVSTITLVKEDPHQPCDWYQKSGVYFFTQFAVKPEYQKIGLGSKLMDFIEDYSQKDGAKELALDTSEKALDLIQLYKKRGYRFVEYANWEVTNYRSIVLSKNLVTG